MTPSNEILFDDHTYYYFRNKANVLLYKGYSPRNDYGDVLLVVQHDPTRNTYYVLFMIKYVVKARIWSDVDPDEFFDTIPLNGINRMAKPIYQEDV